MPGGPPAGCQVLPAADQPRLRPPREGRTGRTWQRPGPRQGRCVHRCRPVPALSGGAACTPRPDRVHKVGQFRGVGVVEEVHVQAHCGRADAGRGIAGGAGCLRAARGHHAGGAKHFAPDVVAVERIEVRLGHRDGPVAVGDGDDGGIQQSAGLRPGCDQGIGHGVDTDGNRAGVEPVQGVEVVDQGLQEDGVRRERVPAAEARRPCRDRGSGTGAAAGFPQRRCRSGCVQRRNPWHTAG